MGEPSASLWMHVGKQTQPWKARPHTHTHTRLLDQSSRKKRRSLEESEKEAALSPAPVPIRSGSNPLGVKGPGDPDRSVRSLDAERGRRVNSGFQSEESDASDQSLFHTEQTDSRQSAHPSVIRLRFPFCCLLPCTAGTQLREEYAPDGSSETSHADTNTPLAPAHTYG